MSLAFSRVVEQVFKPDGRIDGCGMPPAPAGWRLAYVDAPRFVRTAGLLVDEYDRPQVHLPSFSCRISAIMLSRLIT
jgi:hypothetical protein